MYAGQKFAAVFFFLIYLYNFRYTIVRYVYSKVYHAHVKI